MPDAIDTARNALRSAAKAGRVPKGLNLELRPTDEGMHAVVVGASFPVVPREWDAWARARPSERGPMPPCLTTQARDLQSAIVETLQAAMPGQTITCDFVRARSAGVAAVKL